MRAVSVNPVDAKIRANAAPENGATKILGWDAASIVRAVGDKVSLFKPGDRVMDAGDLLRSGTHSDLHLVDERIVGRMPANLSFEATAALPLTTITAWEMLFDRLQISRFAPSATGTLLIVGAAGGVGSVMVQLARKVTGLTVIGTASRPETRQWVRDLAADYVIDHTRPLSGELQSEAADQTSDTDRVSRCVTIIPRCSSGRRE